jgi:DNA-binding transcriptional MerR regulator
MEWSIQQVVRATGVTSRTLRHYAAEGLLSPSRIGHNGYRHYDAAALVRLQRILLLRDLGLGLADIRAVLDRAESEVTALARHLDWLRQEQRRLERQITAVASTIEALDDGEELMAEKMFDGFDHTRYREEVEQKWGADAYTRSAGWWTGLSKAERSAWQARAERLGREWIALAEAGGDPAGVRAQDLARRHVEWLAAVPGTPAATPGADAADYVRGLGDMYVADARFARNYGGEAGARFVRDALYAYVVGPA